MDEYYHTIVPNVTQSSLCSFLHRIQKRIATMRMATAVGTSMVMITSRHLDWLRISGDAPATHAISQAPLARVSCTTTRSRVMSAVRSHVQSLWFEGHYDDPFAPIEDVLENHGAE
jgi:hypothetical protein